MQRILIFAGTTEGRKLAETLDKAGFSCEVCVATEYGREVMPEGRNLHVREGRMGEDGMEALMRQENFLAVVDATHPYAVEVTGHIRRSAARTGLPCLRLSRDTKTEQKEAEHVSDICYADSAAECIRYLKELPGNILLTTGSKELSLYTAEPSLRDRLYVRVLPGMESIAICKEQGLPGKQIIAMQGPFSEKLNEALIEQFEIGVLVTKESGHTGGFPEKIKAAEHTKIPVIVIINPEKDKGDTWEAVLAEIRRLSEVEKAEGSAAEEKSECSAEAEKSEGGTTDEGVSSRLEATSESGHRKPDMYGITLVGIGMGNPELLTGEARRAIAEADYLFGAKRLLEAVAELKKPDAVQKAAYLPGQILPELKDIQGKQRPAKIALLFSGDTGFYSGAAAMHEALRAALAAGELAGKLTICPGISSLSYLAARTGMSWQDARIVSTHGKEADVAGVVRQEKKVFLIVSGAEDMRKLAGELTASGLGSVRLTVGYQMSYPDEQIFETTPKECEGLYEEGLYACMIENPAAELPDCGNIDTMALPELSACVQADAARYNRQVTPGLPDSYFIRGEVPMTKEEVREVSLCKLRLTEHAVLYDIGSGTGSIAVEAARLSKNLTVYAIEHKEKAQELIGKNTAKTERTNLHLVAGEAPECLAALPAPTHAFIGGSGGRLGEILSCLYKKNPNVRVVLNAISLETVAEVTGLIRKLPICEEEIVQLSVGRARRAGGYHLMQAENPVYIVSFTFSESVRQMAEAGEEEKGAENER